MSIIAVPVLVLIIPLVDAALVTVSKVLPRRTVQPEYPGHTSHRLVAIGLSERAAVGWLWALAAVSGPSRC